MALFEANFELGAPGDNLDFTNSGFDGFPGGASTKFDTTLLYSGQSVKIIYAASNSQPRKFVTTTDTVKTRLFFMYESLPSTNAPLISIRAGTSPVTQVSVTPAGALLLLKVNGTVDTTANAQIAINTVYYIEYELNAGVAVARLYNKAGTTLLATLNGTGIAGGVTIVGIGTAASATFTLYLDAFALDLTTQPGYPSTGPIDAIYLWDGTANVAVDAYLWDGTSLIAVDAYWWNGTTLV